MCTAGGAQRHSPVRQVPQLSLAGSCASCSSAGSWQQLSGPTGTGAGAGVGAAQKPLAEVEQWLTLKRQRLDGEGKGLAGPWAGVAAEKQHWLGGRAGAWRAAQLPWDRRAQGRAAPTSSFAPPDPLGATSPPRIPPPPPLAGTARGWALHHVITRLCLTCLYITGKHPCCAQGIIPPDTITGCT